MADRVVQSLGPMKLVGDKDRVGGLWLSLGLRMRRGHG